jgi:c-di-GMP-binding flagellar brake protein YcgR
MAAENRRYERLRAKENTFAAFAGEQARITVGSLVDISEGGLAFEYITEQETDEISQKRAVDVFVLGNVLHVHNIPCTVVYDRPVETSFLRRFKTKRCGVQFGECDAAKAEQLRSFMNNYTAAQ